MGRRHLSLLAAAVLAAAVVTPAEGALAWSELSRGVGTGSPPKAPIGYVAYSRAQASAFAARIPSAKAQIWTVDFSHKAVVAVIGEFGCRDPRVTVQSIAQQGPSLVVSLKLWPLGKGQVECDALFPTFRLLTVGTGKLSRPHPTRVTVRLAGA